MRTFIIVLVFLPALLQGCRKSNGAGYGEAAIGSVDSLPAKAIVSAEYNAFAAESDSLLNHLDAQLAAYNKKIDNPGRRRHVAKSRRNSIQVQYRLDKLREKLQKRTQAYKDAVEKLNATEKDNPRFIQEYRKELRLMESTLVTLCKDTLQQK